MRRLRITFRRGEALKYLSHLEMMRLWERTFRRAGWRLAYSQGFNPHPKISFAAALPVGVAGEAELLEVHLDGAPEVPASDLSHHLPPGLEVRTLEEVPLEAPSVQRALVAAEYLALAPVGVSLEAVRRGVERMLAAATLPRQRVKDEKVVSYDLRPMLRALAAEEGPDGRVLVRMELRTDVQGAGRPDEVLRELDLDPADCAITRIRLLLG